VSNYQDTISAEPHVKLDAVHAIFGSLAKRYRGVFQRYQVADLAPRWPISRGSFKIKRHQAQTWNLMALCIFLPSCERLTFGVDYWR
jgi:hypothetical protein